MHASGLLAQSFALPTQQKIQAALRPSCAGALHAQNKKVQRHTHPQQYRLPTAVRAVTPAEDYKPAGLVATPQQPIRLTDDAVKHLKRLREDSGGEEMLLRVGVKSGGCSGMSYTMDFEDGANVGKDDSVIEHEGFKLVCDSMSLLYLFGMTLDYSNKLIGGGFLFQNPNAQSNCGCGKSFGV